MWFKVVQLIKRYRFIVLLFLGLNSLVAIIIFYYPHYRLMVWQKKITQPFIQDAKASLGEDTPVAAYHVFWQALQDNQKETALSLIIGLRRDYYRQVWQDEALWQLDRALPETVDLYFQSDCLPEAVACKQRAILTYQSQDLGRPLGQIELYQNLAGRWQIGDIY